MLARFTYVGSSLVFDIYGHYALIFGLVPANSKVGNAPRSD